MREFKIKYVFSSVVLVIYACALGLEEEGQGRLFLKNLLRAAKNSLIMLKKMTCCRLQESI